MLLYSYSVTLGDVQAFFNGNCHFLENNTVGGSVSTRLKPVRFKPVFWAKIKNRYLYKKPVFRFFGFFFNFPPFLHFFLQFPPNYCILSSIFYPFFLFSSIFAFFQHFFNIFLPFFRFFCMGASLHYSKAIKLWITRLCIAILTTCWQRRAGKKHSWSI